MNVNNIRRIIRKGSIQKSVPMCEHTTFKTGGNAAWFIVPGDTNEAAGLIRYLYLNKIPYFVTGNGSNLLVSDRGYDGVIVNIGRNDGTTFTALGYETTEEGLLFDAGAGCLMTAIGNIAARLGGSGFEALSGIPGCLGGALIMNAGAYGSEICDVVKSVEAITKEGKIVHLNKDEINFRYRGSSLMDEGYIVTRAEIVLTPGDPDQIKEKSDGFLKQRADKQPLEFPSAGSSFKRPEGDFAGRLIMEAGLKGVSVGGAQVSEKHAGFIINKGGASSTDIYELMHLVQDKVQEQFGVLLEPEIRFLGDF